MPATLAIHHPAVAGLGIDGATEAHAAAKADQAKAAKAAKVSKPATKKPGQTKVEKAIKQRNEATAKKLLATVKQPRKSNRPHGHKPTPKDLDDCTPRDRKKYNDAILKIVCPTCSAGKGAPCVSDTDKKCELRSPHGPRKAAAAK